MKKRRGEERRREEKKRRDEEEWMDGRKESNDRCKGRIEGWKEMEEENERIEEMKRRGKKRKGSMVEKRK